MQRQQSMTNRAFGFMAIGFLLLTMTTGQAQAASGNGPYYAEPSWSQKLPAATRFVVLTDWNSEAVLDRETGLVWERSPATRVETWSNARFTCVNKIVGGRKGWRLPAITELTSLIDPSVISSEPTLPSGHPFVGVLSVGYWSATTTAIDPRSAWNVLFGLGAVGANSKTDDDQVWCVRGGMNADQY